MFVIGMLLFAVLSIVHRMGVNERWLATLAVVMHLGLVVSAWVYRRR